MIPLVLLLSIGDGFIIECVNSPLILYSTSSNYWKGENFFENSLNSIEVYYEIYQRRIENGGKRGGDFRNI